MIDDENKGGDEYEDEHGLYDTALHCTTLSLT